MNIKRDRFHRFELDPQETRAFMDGEKLRICPECGDEFVVVEGRTYSYKKIDYTPEITDKILCYGCSQND